jgi:hypothetical protein
MRAGRSTLPLTVVLVAIGCLASVPADVQHQPPQPATSPSSVDRLGISLKNIRRQLQAAPAIASGELRYNIQVEVVGKEPRLEFFRDFNLSPSGGVRYGSPTHQEILNMATPLPFRNWVGGVDVLSLGKKQ